MSDNNSSSFLTVLEIDENDNLTFEFPDELLEALGWKEGDNIEISTFAGRVVLGKVPVDD